MTSNHMSRLQTNDCRLEDRVKERCNTDIGIVELGATEAVQQHMSRHVVATKPVSQRKLDFEHARYFDSLRFLDIIIAK